MERATSNAKETSAREVSNVRGPKTAPKESPILLLFDFDLRHRSARMASICSGAMTVLGRIPLVSHFGLGGAAYGMLVSATTYAVNRALSSFLVLYRRPVEQYANPELWT